jgi:hypothetical protein
MVALPSTTIDTSVTDFSQPVTTSAIDPAANLTGFQGDFTFDSSVVSFQNPAISVSGLSAAANCNVTGTLLPGGGPLRTLHVAGLSNNATPLSGAGVLFNLNLTRVASTPGTSTSLTWNGSPDNFVYLDPDQNARPPLSTPPGNITVQALMTISGSVSYCSSPSQGPIPNVTFTLTGTSTGSVQSDSSGNYQFPSLFTGGNYTVTATKAPLPQGSVGINTVDVIATQRHFLGVTLLPPGCRLTAADVNGDSSVNTVDVVAIQRFYLGVSTGTANVGKYQFTPANRTYPSASGDQTAQDYSALVFGDVSSPFADLPSDPEQNVAGSNQDEAELAPSVSTVTLPNVILDPSLSNDVVPVTTSVINPKSKLVGFQGDFTFDERVVAFSAVPVQSAGLTVHNWNVSGNVLDGRGPIRTLRVSAFSTTLEPLSGAGTLFELRLQSGNQDQRTHLTPLIWAAPPNHFIFIDADLNTQSPIRVTPGSIAR